MDDTATTGREGDQPTTAKSSIRENNLTIDDHGARQSSKADTVTMAAIETRVLTLVEARMLVESFQAMVRKKLVADLDPWIATASLSLIASFASGVLRDKAAVRAAITEPWSNGQTEGQITKLKLVKCQMYGRAKIDLLQARLIGAR